MKRDLLEILACPKCKGALDVEVTDEQNEEIVSGILCCNECGNRFPIENTIPNFLPPELKA